MSENTHIEILNCIRLSFQHLFEFERECCSSNVSIFKRLFLTQIYKAVNLHFNVQNFREIATLNLNVAIAGLNTKLAA